uniref:Uncharacterized protein n=1 Tax=Poecilia latipinna TaxID=48699 RepID=A0A3B3U7T2_9TELE
MDVRFYPTAGGNSIPGDPSNLDFAHCLGYYNFNKTILQRRLGEKFNIQSWKKPIPTDLQV